MKIRYFAPQAINLVGSYCGTEVDLSLESLPDARGHKPLATMSVTHYGDPDLVRNVPSEDVVQLWTESLLHAANADLKVQVVFLVREGNCRSAWIEEPEEVN